MTRETDHEQLQRSSVHQSFDRVCDVVGAHELRFLTAGIRTIGEQGGLEPLLAKEIRHLRYARNRCPELLHARVGIEPDHFGSALRLWEKGWPRATRAARLPKRVMPPETNDRRLMLLRGTIISFLKNYQIINLCENAKLLALDQLVGLLVKSSRSGGQPFHARMQHLTRTADLRKPHGGAEGCSLCLQRSTSNVGSQEESGKPGRIELVALEGLMHELGGTSPKEIAT